MLSGHVPEGRRPEDMPWRRKRVRPVVSDAFVCLSESWFPREQAGSESYRNRNPLRAVSREVRDDAREVRAIRPERTLSGRSPWEAPSLSLFSLPQGSCALPHSPWRTKFLATVFLGILLCALIAFMIKIMTTTVYAAPAMCQALPERFTCIDLLNPCDYGNETEVLLFPIYT